MDLRVVARGDVALLFQELLVAGIARLPVTLENLQDAGAEIDAVPGEKLAGRFGAAPRNPRSAEAQAQVAVAVKPGELQVGVLGGAPPRCHVVAVGQAELDVLLVVLRHEETSAGFGPKPRLCTPAWQALSAGPLFREQIGRRITGEVVVRSLSGMASERDGDQLTGDRFPQPRERGAGEQGFTETEPGVNELEAVTAPMVDNGEAFDHTTG